MIVYNIQIWLTEIARYISSSKMSRELTKLDKPLRTGLIPL